MLLLLLCAGFCVSVVGCRLSVVGCRLLVVGCWLLVAGCWLLVAGCWLLVAGCWLLVAGYWLLVIGYWLLVVGCVFLVVWHENPLFTGGRNETVNNGFWVVWGEGGGRRRRGVNRHRVGVDICRICLVMCA